MFVDNYFLHNFYYSYKIFDKNQFINLLKSILTYSLVSYNYYQKLVGTNEGYKQNWNAKINGYSKDYVSLVYLKDIFSETRKYKRSEIVDFMQTGAFILIKKDWVEKLLEDSKNTSIFEKPQAIKREFINPFIGKYNLEYLISKGMEYVIPGEVKVKDYIPSEEICGLVFGEYFFKDNANDLNIIKKILLETNMEHLELYNLISDIPCCIENVDNIKKYELKKLN